MVADFNPFIYVSQIQWVNWMEGMPDYVVDPNMRFSDIIVPTSDTVRAHFLLELLVSNFKQVLVCVCELCECVYMCVCVCVCVRSWSTSNA